MAAKKQEHQMIELPPPTALHFLLETAPHTVGELLAFADSVPTHWIEPMLIMLANGLKLQLNPDVRRRKIVVLAVLANRLVFEIEGIPARKSHVI